MIGIIIGLYCSQLGANVVRFHYRADVLLGFFDSLHFREIRYSCSSTQRVLVFYLTNKNLGIRVEKVQKKKVSNRSTTEKHADKKPQAAPKITAETQHEIKHTSFPKK